MKSRILLGVILSTGIISAATTVPQVQTFSFIPNDNVPLTFTKFNPALGTLTGITITTVVNKSGGALFVDNEAGSGASGNISQSVTINLSSSDVNLISDAFNPIGNNISAVSNYFATVGPDNGDGPGVQPDAPGLDYDGSNFGPVNGAPQASNVLAAVFGGYTGLGTYTINAAGSQGFGAGGFGGASIGVSPATVSGSVTVTYSYVPEPNAALLGGIGMLALLRRRR